MFYVALLKKLGLSWRLLECDQGLAKVLNEYFSGSLKALQIFNMHYNLLLFSACIS